MSESDECWRPEREEDDDGWRECSVLPWSRDTES